MKHWYVFAKHHSIAHGFQCCVHVWKESGVCLKANLFSAERIFKIDLIAPFLFLTFKIWKSVYYLLCIHWWRCMDHIMRSWDWAQVASLTGPSCWTLCLIVFSFFLHRARLDLFLSSFVLWLSLFRFRTLALYLRQVHNIFSSSTGKGHLVLAHTRFIPWNHCSSAGMLCVGLNTLMRTLDLSAQTLKRLSGHTPLTVLVFPDFLG